MTLASSTSSQLEPPFIVYHDVPFSTGNRVSTQHFVPFQMHLIPTCLLVPSTSSYGTMPARLDLVSNFHIQPSPSIVNKKPETNCLCSNLASTCTFSPSFPTGPSDPLAYMAPLFIGEQSLLQPHISRTPPHQEENPDMHWIFYLVCPHSETEANSM